MFFRNGRHRHSTRASLPKDTRSINAATLRRQRWCCYR